MYKLKNRIYSTLNVIRRRYSPQEVPWRGIHNVIAAAMSMFNNTPHSALSCHSLPQGTREKSSVAFCNKVMDTHLPLPVGSGDKYDIGSVQCGRSMIEMLGVLAIIAVLSVGGITGYSKAMGKFKTNKLMSQYSILIYGLLPYIKELPNTGYEGTPVKNGYTELAKTLNLIPKSWKIESTKIVRDDLNNILHLFVRNNRLAFDVYPSSLGGTRQYLEFCQNFTKNFIQPLHYSIYYIRIYDEKKGLPVDASVQWGDNYCSSNRKCIIDLSFSEIKAFCENCHSGKPCAINIEFE